MGKYLPAPYTEYRTAPVQTGTRQSVLSRLCDEYAGKDLIARNGHHIGQISGICPVRKGLQAAHADGSYDEGFVVPFGFVRTVSQDTVTLSCSFSKRKPEGLRYEPAHASFEGMLYGPGREPILCFVKSAEGLITVPFEVPDKVYRGFIHTVG